MVCFWYDFKAAWNIVWKREELEDAVVSGTWDMINCDGGGIYEVVWRTWRRMYGSGNEDSETGQRATSPRGQSRQRAPTSPIDARWHIAISRKCERTC